MQSNTASELAATIACPENSLRPLLKETLRIDPEMRVESLRRRFETLGSIASAVVVRQDRPVGLIMSHRMDRLLSSHSAAILGYAEMSLLETDLSRPINCRLRSIMEADRSRWKRYSRRRCI